MTQIQATEIVELSLWFRMDLPCEHSLHDTTSPYHSGPATHRFRMTMPCCGDVVNKMVCAPFAERVVAGTWARWRCLNCDARTPRKQTDYTLVAL